MDRIGEFLAGLDLADHEDIESSQETNIPGILNSEIVFDTVIEDESNDPAEDEYLKAYYQYADDFEGPIQPEPILSSSAERFTVYPIDYPTIWNNYKNMQKINWVVEEVDLSKDLHDWENLLNQNERIFIMHVLAFFATADGIVNANIKQNIIDVIKIKEAECAYGKQFDMENVHGEMYSLMLDAFVTDNKLKKQLINAIRTLPAVRRKAEWCQKWINSDKPFIHKLVAFSIVEGIFFSGSFASIFWLKTKKGNPMPGLRKSNRFIARDEYQHVVLAYEINSLLKNKLKESVIHEILLEAIEIEKEFINDSLPCSLLGMNAALMSEYIEYCADRHLVRLGYKKIYHHSLPFEFMKKIDVFCKANFFEQRNDTYSDSKISSKREFRLIENF